MSCHKISINIEKYFSSKIIDFDTKSSHCNSCNGCNIHSFYSCCWTGNCLPECPCSSFSEKYFIIWIVCISEYSTTKSKICESYCSSCCCSIHNNTRFEHRVETSFGFELPHRTESTCIACRNSGCRKSIRSRYSSKTNICKTSSSGHIIAKSTTYSIGISSNSLLWIQKITSKIIPTRVNTTVNIELISSESFRFCSITTSDYYLGSI